MTDYLELFSEENEHVLLELERRMDRALEGALWGNGGQDGSSEGSEGWSGREESLESQSRPERSDRAIEPVWRADTAGGTQKSRQSKEKPVRADGEIAERAGERKPLPALEKQLGRLERAAATFSGGAAGAALHGETGRSERGGGWRRAAELSYPNARRRATWENKEISGPVVQSGAVRGSAGTDGAREWAEHMDRVIRHDIRRYDGGFYLY